MKTIYKGVVSLGTNEVEVPGSGRVISAGVQNGRLVIWYEVETSNIAREIIIVNVYFTGDLLSDNPGRFIASLQNNGLVYHIYAL